MRKQLRTTIPVVAWFFTLGFLVLFLIAHPPDGTQWWAAFWFGFLLVFTDTFGISTGSGYASLYPMISLTAYLVLGLPYASLLTFVSAMAFGVVRACFAEKVGMKRPSSRRQLVRLVTANGTMQTASILLSGFIYEEIIGIPSLNELNLETLWPLALLVASYLIINHAIAAIYFFIQGLPHLRAYLIELPTAFMYEVMPVIFAPAVALIYLRLGSSIFIFLAAAMVIISLAMHNLDQMRQRLERRVQELDSLQAVGQALSVSLSLDKVLQAVYEQVASLMPASIFYVALYDQEKDEISFPSFLMEGETTFRPPRQPANGFTEHVIRSKEPLLIRKNLLQVSQKLNLQIIGDVAKSWLGVPLIAADQVLGVLSVQSLRQDEVYDETHQKILMTIAAQAAVAIENAYLYTRTDSALAQRVQELDSVLRTTQNGILLLDPRTYVLADNQAFREIVGLNGTTIQGKLATHWPSEADSLLMRMGYSLLNWEADCRELGARQIPRKQAQIAAYSDAERLFERKLAPVFGDGDVIAGWLLVFRDISEEMELERLRQEMTHMLVHDLRAPLSVMKSSLDLAKSDLAGQEGSSLFELLSFMEISGDRLLKLVDDLLDIHQFETGQVPLIRRAIPVTYLLGNLVIQFEPVVAEMGIALSVAAEATLPSLWVDEGYISRALQNLVDNAIKFTPDNGRITLSATYEPDTHTMLVAVQDNGFGIKQAVQPQLFQKFQKDLTGNGRRKGSGLGLSFCKLVVEAHGGEIWVESNGISGEGSRFVMRLPVDH
jgi:signal transduction histidine kinase